MQKQVCLYDLVNQKIEFDGLAEVEFLSDQSWIVRMKSDEIETTWKILKKGVVIENYGEVDVIVTLYEKGSGIARIFSPYGELRLPLRATSIEKNIMDNTEEICVRYAIEQADEPFGFTLRIESLPR